MEFLIRLRIRFCQRLCDRTLVLRLHAGQYFSSSLYRDYQRPSESGFQHKSALDPKAFTARYGINRLVYFERFHYVRNAIAREKQIKSWNRVKKIDLIVAVNPTWRDLSEDWKEGNELFDEKKMRPPSTF